MFPRVSNKSRSFSSHLILMNSTFADELVFNLTSTDITSWATRTINHVEQQTQTPKILVHHLPVEKRVIRTQNNFPEPCDDLPYLTQFIACCFVMRESRMGSPWATNGALISATNWRPTGNAWEGHVGTIGDQREPVGDPWTPMGIHGRPREIHAGP